MVSGFNIFTSRTAGKIQDSQQLGGSTNNYRKGYGGISKIVVRTVRMCFLHIRNRCLRCVSKKICSTASVAIHWHFQGNQKWFINAHQYIYIYLFYIKYIYIHMFFHWDAHRPSTTVDGWNPAPVDRYIVYPIIYRVLYIPGGAGFQPSTVVANTSLQGSPNLNIYF